MERFVERLFDCAFCSLRSHGTRDKAGSIIDKGYRERVSVEAFCSLRSHGHGKDATCAYSARISARLVSAL